MERWLHDDGKGEKMKEWRQLVWGFVDRISAEEQREQVLLSRIALAHTEVDLMGGLDS
jgi:hypothetical protein